MPKFARLVAALALLVLTSCDVRGRVLFVGDSNTVLHADVFTSYLYGGVGDGVVLATPPAYLPTFAAVSGAGYRDTAAWVESLESVDAAHDFDAVVLALGLNDAAASGCTADMPAKITAVIDALPADVPILLLNAPFVPSTVFNQTCILGVNVGLLWESQANARVTLIEVNGILNAMPAPVLRFADGVHYSDPAAFEIAEAIVAALDGVL